MLSQADTPMFQAEQAKRTLIGLARDVRGIANSFNSKACLYDAVRVDIPTVLRGVTEGPGGEVSLLLALLTHIQRYFFGLESSLFVQFIVLNHLGSSDSTHIHNSSYSVSLL